MIFKTDYFLEDYILNCKWEYLPVRVQERAVVCAVDLTCALLLGCKGRQFETGLSVARQLYKTGKVPVIGSQERFDFMGAVHAMCHAANSFDIDDGHNMIRGHPGASFVGGVLAAALQRGLRYQDYLTALVVSYEAAVRWALAMQDFYGFLHSTGAYGSFGTAVGVGKLFGLDRKTLNSALSIADFHAPMTPVMRAVEYPSMNKDGVPFGTITGALSVIEAMNGYNGRTHLLEMPEYRYLLDSLGNEFEIMNLYFKPFTCCRWAHQPISASLALMGEHGFSSPDIAKVYVYTFEAAARLSKIVPENTDEAQYNIAYPVAAAFVHGRVGFAQVCDEALGNNATHDLMKKMEFIVDPELESIFPAKRAARVRVELLDGRQLSSAIFEAPGEAADNVGLEWITQKFYTVTEYLLPWQKSEDILDFLTGGKDVPVNGLIELINR